METRFIALKELFQTLHGPQGCQWDKEQTHQSILAHLREEVDEFIEAVEKGDSAHMREELGDLLLHVMFHAQIAEKEGAFTIEEVIETLIDKLKRRHPHVFGNLKLQTTRQIIANWEKIKEQERAS
ncbi:MAG: hypothetical protein MJA29_10355 [Candidatus Omnitrophica bacterium]|nr:hypothetical protein [Candidatus Omnitrophota bacterium]